MNKILFQHKILAEGRWYELTLFEQMGNIGSEISRACGWKDRDEEQFRNAIFRALDLIDLTAGDKRWADRLKEILRARELVCDAAFGNGQYNTTLQNLDDYFFQFARAARKNL